MRILYLVYHPDNWRGPFALPCDFEIVRTNKDFAKLKRFLEWPDTHIVCSVNNDNSVRTQTDVAGLRVQAQAGWSL